MPEPSDLSVVSFEGRRASDMAALLDGRVSEVLCAPAMRVVHLQAGPDVVELGARLRDGTLEAMLFLTGVGVHALFEVASPVVGRSELGRGLSEIVLGARGPKTAAALRELGLEPDVESTPPHTWRRLLEDLGRERPLAGLAVAVQEYGVAHGRLKAALQDRGAEVLQVAVYRWALPEDVRPLNEAIDRLCERRASVALFTNEIQVENLFAVAAERDLDEALRESLRAGVVGAVGSVCAERLSAFGVPADVVPERARMQGLVDAVVSRAASVLEEKNG